VPGASSPWIDPWAPPQYFFGQSGGSGAVRSPGGDDMNGQNQTYDSTLHYKLAGTIIGALLLVFVLQQLGFRFVVAAGVGR
jgi:hypothetical protein